MKIQRFEDIIAWQKAQELAVFIYKLFKNSRDFGFKDQITRAAVSISSNIAEGFERNTDADFSRFLSIAKGSNSEVKSLLYLAKKLEYLNENEVQEGLTFSNEIGKILNGLINSLKKISN